MKKSLLMILAAFLCFSFCGCSFQFQSIDLLMRPPLTETERELEESIGEILGKNISLHTPSAGENHSAISLHDLDGDGLEEAIVFYTNNSDAEVVRMSVLKMTSSGWKLVSDFAGNGSGVYSIDFFDLNNDSCDDMLVSWYLFEDKVNKTLTVYSGKRNGNSISFSACATEPFNLMCVEELFSDGEKQIILAYSDISQSSAKSHIRLMRLNSDNQVELVCETKLDDRITGVSSLKTDCPSQTGKPRVFVDALIPDNKMVTEVFVWDVQAESFKRLVSGEGQTYNDRTVRTNNLISYDTDNDGLIEIPVRENLLSKTSADKVSGYLLVWYELSPTSTDSANLSREDNYAVNTAGRYKMFIPPKLADKLYIKSEKNNMVWHFVTESDQELFSVSVFSAEYWEEEKPDVTEILFIGVDNIYACNITEYGYSCGVEETDLIQYFSLNN